MMAEEALRKLEEQLNCSICLDAYTDPKLLSCNHVYCQLCLGPLVVQDQQGQPTLSCPTCRQVTPVPASGVAGLQSAFHIKNLQEIKDSVKKIKDLSLGTQDETVEVIKKHESPPKNHTCSKHAEEELKLYCETCTELICLHCVIKGCKHHSHDYKMLDEAFTMYKGKIASFLNPMEKQLTVISQALAQIDTRDGEIADHRVAIEADIHSTIGQLHEALDARKVDLIDSLHQITQWKLKGLAAQRDQIETTQAQLSNCLLLLRESLKANSQGEVMTMKATIGRQIKELASSFRPEFLKPNTEADMTFTVSPVEMSAMCQSFGQVSTVDSPDVSKCHAAGTGLEVAVVGEKSSAVLHAVNFEGKLCEGPIKSLQCELVSMLTGIETRGSVERREQSQYEITYQPKVRGRNQLHIKIEGQHIRGSPFSVAVTAPVIRFSSPILTIGKVVKPAGIAVNERGEVVVTEWDRDRVSVFSPGGKKLRSFGRYGSGQGQFQTPRGVAVDGEGNILVADSYNHRIQVFSAEGQFITAVGVKGSGPLQFYRPTGIAINTSNNKAYVLDLNHRVQILNSDLTFSSTFGKRGGGKVQFDNPYGIACDSSGQVYVADSGNNRVQILTAEGEFVRAFGKRGEGVIWPTCIAVDPTGLVYVSEFNHCISLFTSEGRFVSAFGRKGGLPGEFNFPRGLAVASDGSRVVYVCDHGNNRVQIF